MPVSVGDGMDHHFRHHDPIPRRAVPELPQTQILTSYSSTTVGPSVHSHLGSSVLGFEGRLEDQIADWFLISCVIADVGYVQFIPPPQDEFH